MPVETSPISSGTLIITISEALSLVQMSPDGTRPPIIHMPPPLEAVSGNNQNVNSAFEYASNVSGCSSRETAIDMTPTNHIAFLSTKAHWQAPSSCEVYVESMFPLKKGYPLFFPQPDQNLPKEYRQKGVSHEDVGIITSDGAFDFLFNIWYSAQDPINPNDLPENFVSLSPSGSETLFQLVVNYDGHLSNMDIVSEESENTSDISYTCKSGDKGSLLSLPYGAYQEDLKSQLDLKEFISKNAISWYRYALAKGRDIDRHSLCLVTGSIKSSSWGIATFDKSVAERSSMLVIGESHRVDRPSLKWKKTGGASSSRTGPSPNGIPDSINNQCLFLRGFRISLSEEAWDGVWKVRTTVVINENGKRPLHQANANGSRLTKKNRNSGDLSETHSSSRTDLGCNLGIVSDLSLKSSLFHPLNEVNEMLFSVVPEAQVAIMHDDLWIEACKEGYFDAEEFLKTIQDHFVVGYCNETRTCTVEPRINVTTTSWNNGRENAQTPELCEDHLSAQSTLITTPAQSIFEFAPPSPDHLPTLLLPMLSLPSAYILSPPGYPAPTPSPIPPARFQARTQYQSLSEVSAQAEHQSFYSPLSPALPTIPFSPLVAVYPPAYALPDEINEHNLAGRPGGWRAGYDPHRSLAPGVVSMFPRGMSDVHGSFPPFIPTLSLTHYQKECADPQTNNPLPPSIHPRPSTNILRPVLLPLPHHPLPHIQHPTTPRLPLRIHEPQIPQHPTQTQLARSSSTSMHTQRLPSPALPSKTTLVHRYTRVPSERGDGVRCVDADAGAVEDQD
ncbi:hypothetical protein BDQ17DRAFT_270246 [Cyathus striatus]|nr:hypothetical protein BDQ17DRAFT_270246 [Cyathus striatus]